MGTKVDSEVWFEGSNSCDDWDWDDTCAWVTDLMRDMFGEYVSQWSVEVSGFGWRGDDGEGVIEADDGRELLLGVLPNTVCNFKIYKQDGCIAINNSHHDKPCGGEWYYIKPYQESEE